MRETGIDRNDEGFWCDSCDCFTYYDPTKQHRFTLIFEDKTLVKTKFPASNLKFSKTLSPLRYAGGKSKLIDYLYSHIETRTNKSKKLVSAFTGGGSFELAMLHAGIVDELHLNDLDFGIYSLWWTILHAPYTLIDRIINTSPSHKDFFASQRIIKSDYKGIDAIDAAWATLLVNRLAYSGIVKANPLGGKNGTKEALLSRWNPQVLIKRIELIHSYADRITITCEDAASLIEEAYWDDESIIFLDPPYLLKGKDLYTRFYTERDHVRLCVLLEQLYKGMPGADILLTYDYSEWLDKLHVYPDIEIIGCNYSI